MTPSSSLNNTGPKSNPQESPKNSEKEIFESMKGVDYMESYRNNVPIEKFIPLGNTINFQLFYYEEDYYDSVNSQIILVEAVHGALRIDPSIRIQTITNNEFFIFHRHHKQGDTLIGYLKPGNDNEPKLIILNSHNRLRYGSDYIKSNNNLYRESCIEGNGTIKKEIIAKPAYHGIEVEYRKNIYTQL